MRAFFDKRTNFKSCLNCVPEECELDSCVAKHAFRFFRFDFQVVRHRNHVFLVLLRVAFVPTDTLRI
jgi:hypothetical protein